MHLLSDFKEGRECRDPFIEIEDLPQAHLSLFHIISFIKSTPTEDFMEVTSKKHPNFQQIKVLVTKQDFDRFQISASTQLFVCKSVLSLSFCVV